MVNGGISNDDLPFIVLVVAATYLAAYLAAWSIFRWYNAWLGLIPGGLALLTNISYLPGQHSMPLLIYLFCSILLVARVNLLRRAREWKAHEHPVSGLHQPAPCSTSRSGWRWACWRRRGCCR